MNARIIIAELRRHADPDIAAHSRRFFKAVPGGYGEGDSFLGIRVPVVRKIAAKGRDLPHDDVLELLWSEWHEERLLALVVMVERFKRGDDEARGLLHRAYLQHIDRVDNWDLVDLSAPYLVGEWLHDRDREVLDRLAAASCIWQQRIAVMATFAFIRAGEYPPTFALADRLLEHEHDLIHKAVGWMLREVGKRDREVEETFLKSRYDRMPRTMLRYAIEKFPEPLRRAYLESRA